MDFPLVLETITRGFEEKGIRYALVGGLAVHAWGRSRPTQDADFAVDESNRAAALEIVGTLGYRTAFESSGFSNHEHSDPRWGHVDFMYLTGATADAVFGATSAKELVPGHGVPVASPEHLAMMKARAMKNFPHRTLYEGEDVRLLLSVPGVDRQQIREYFAKLDLLDLFDAIEKAR